MRNCIAVCVGLVACSGPVKETGTAPPATTTTTETDTDTAEPIEIVWESVGMQTSDTFNAVYSGAADAYVVGSDGAGWVVAPGGQAEAIRTDTEEDLYGLWGNGDGANVQLVAVGTSGAVTQTGPKAPSVDDLGTANFYDVDGSPEDLTAVGWGGVFRRTNEAWRFESTPAGLQLNSVWVEPGGDTAVAVGLEGAIAERVNDVWSLVASPTTVDLYGVAGRNRNELWVVGEDGVLLAWDGTEWHTLDLDTSNTLWAVWQAASGEVFAVGNNGYAARFDGSGVFRQVHTGVDANLYAVHGATADTVWAVGSSGEVLRYVP